jgi:hypothetical protein
MLMLRNILPTVLLSPTRSPQKDARQHVAALNRCSQRRELSDGGAMREQLTGVVEGQASEDDISSRQHTLTIRFAKLGLTALTASLLLGVGGAHAICPCGDGVCGGATCLPPETAQTCPADCGSGPPAESHPDSALDEVIDCDSTQELDIRAVAWNIVDDWSDFRSAVENETDKNLGNCIEKRFSTNGRVRCVSEYHCNNKGCKLGHAPGLSQQIQIYQTFFDNTAALPQAVRRACYAGLMTHEFSHSCERYEDGPNSLPELREDAAFNYWKDRFADWSTLDANDACGFD